MRGVRGDASGPPTHLLVERNNRGMQNDQNGVRDGAGDAQGLSEEDESKINEDGENVNDGRRTSVQVQGALHAQQQQPQGSMVRWERFLPLRSLKVLLVENDDSTRHIVCALLRNCSYEVTAVANGLEAWKILEDLTNHIDLVLSEVAMPYLSGVGLLSRIMNHKIRKNIPVIMMSSNDSMGIVLKCLSKGAVDFLVKPIRKNELKILWQHLWRRCHSSSGSGSESGIWTQKSQKSKSVEGSENSNGSNNHNDSNNQEDNGSIGLNVRDGSDNGSGTQGSWSKRAVEVDSPRPMSPWDELADPPDSTCAQVIYPRPEELGSNWEPMTATRELEKKDNGLDDVEMGKDLKIGVHRDSDLQLDSTDEILDAKAGVTKGKSLDLEIRRDIGTSEGKSKLDNENEDAVHTGAIANPTNSFMDASAHDVPNEPSKITHVKDKVTYNAKEIPSLALSLKRELDNETWMDDLKSKDAGHIIAIANPEMESSANEDPEDPSRITNIKDMATYDSKKIPSFGLNLKQIRDDGDTGTSVLERTTLRHSNLSAFSKYNATSTANPAPTGNVGSCSHINNSLEAGKTESMQILQSNSSGMPNQLSSGSSNNNDMASSTNNAFFKPEACTDKLAPLSAMSIYPCSAFQPVQHEQNSSVQPIGTNTPDTTKIALAQAKAMNQHVRVHLHHTYHHHHHHHVHNSHQQQQLLSHQALSIRDIVAASPHCRPTEMQCAPVEGNAANYGSTSGSNNGSNGQNGSSTGVTTEGTNGASDNGAAGKCGVGEGGGSGSRSGVDQNRFAQRQAALSKFRQKQKERCFEKKVRYHSRKRLAEQRPRVRGQFVQQAVDKNKNKETNC